MAWGRTGDWFGYQQFGIEPDGMSIAKALGNGFPIGAFEVAEKWSDVLKVGSHASTFGGSPLACAAALSVFEVFEKDDVLFNCQKMGEYLKDKLIQLVVKHSSIKDIRGQGLMIGIEMSCPVNPILKHAADQGLLILKAGDNVIRLLPPLVITQAEVQAGVEILETAIAGIL